MERCIGLSRKASLRSKVKKFEKHHAALLVFLMIASVFVINVMAFSAAYDDVRSIRETGDVPIVVVESSGASSQNENTETGYDFLVALRPVLQSIIEKEGIEMAVYVQDLSTGEVLGINEKTTFVSASLYKIFVSYEVARQIDIGLIDPAQNTGGDADGLTVRQCLDKMLSVSDNPCGRALRKLIGGDNSPLPAISEAGFIGTSLVLDYPTTSAADTALYFSRLYHGDTFSPETNDLLLQPLLDQEINNRLPIGVPEGTQIAHKTADLDGYSHDGGIFYTPGGDYILVVLSGPWPNGYTDSPSAHIAISKVVYEWFNGTNTTADF